MVSSVFPLGSVLVSLSLAAATRWGVIDEVTELPVRDAEADGLREPATEEPALLDDRLRPGSGGIDAAVPKSAQHREKLSGPAVAAALMMLLCLLLLLYYGYGYGYGVWLLLQAIGRWQI